MQKFQYKKYVPSHKHFKKALKSVWVFPGAVVLALLTLTILNLNGSSIGVYNAFLYGDGAKDPNLILGKPQTVRSDEWLVNTQMTIAQEKNNFQAINPNFLENKDMSIVIDAPYKEWSTLFKPQNLSFFVLPFEQAFAFKWWFLISVLLISVYFFSLRLLPGKIWLSIAISIAFSLSPFIFWWYQTSTVMTLTYGFLVLLTGMSLIDGNKIKIFKKELGAKTSLALKTAGLAYILTAFALILYPPFQIPIALVVGFFLLGYFIKKMNGKSKKNIALTFLPFIAAVAITGAICGAYIVNRLDTIHTISNTAYPGKRVVASGSYDIKKLLVNYLQPQLQHDSKGSKYILNQSESSSFTLLPIFFIIPAIAVLTWIYIKQRKFEWVLASIITCNLLFLSYLFIPGIDTIAKLFLLQLVPHDRLLIGLGFATIILVIYLIKLIVKYYKPTKEIVFFMVAYSLLFFTLIVWAGLETSKLYPDFISNKKLIILLAAFLCTSMTLILFNKPKIAITLLALFSIASVFQIHPLYRGMGPIYNSDISKTIQEISPKGSTWAAAQHIYIENVPQMSGRPAITGVLAYPNLKFWDNFSETSDNSIYNRYAHSLLSSNDESSATLVASDFYTLSAACTRKITQKIEFIISTTPLEGSCNTLIKTLPYPNATFYFYKQ